MNGSKMILGTVQFGIDYGINNSNGKINPSEVYAILDHAIENSITILDTAATYGSAEHVIGNYIRTMGYNPFTIISKLVYSGQASIVDLIQSSLMKLNVDTIDVMMLHRFQDLKSYPEVLEELVTQKETGSIQSVGISVYSNEELHETINIEEIEVIQLPFNLLDNHHKRGKVLQEAKKKGKTIHTRSVFLQGLFFKPLNEYPDKLKPLIPYVKKLKELAVNANVPLLDLALHYSLSKEYIDGVLFGVDSQEQLEQNIKSLKRDIYEEIFHDIDELNVEESDLLNPVNWTK